MNTHLKQLWAAMKLPEKLQKSYKFFCRGLDIRVSQVVKSQMFQSCIFQNLLVDVDHRIGVVHFACFRGRKHPRVTIEILYKNKMSFLRCLLCACRFHPAARQSAALFLLDFLFVCFIMVLCILRR